ncbi:ATP-grasp domain-containing protein [Kitasatospora mediocidica]|uniref:ATP-grasp domain-containing protein n=1 Tax=Kitasatospora mediocidica TaxID=58352 RepID=UPI00068CA80F|nr:ATP-grasp domain-containing protein [Kitasatospora mediocidica]
MSSRGIPHYLVINRFDDEFGEYHRFVEPGSCRLSYITLACGLPVLDAEGATALVVVPDLDLGTVLPVARRLAELHGGFDAVVGPSEYDVLSTAQLRAELGVPGWTPEFVTPFRDKARMKDLVGAAGVRVPRFCRLDASSTAASLVAEIGLPLVLKPRAGWSARGVVRVTEQVALATALAGLAAPGPAGYECEEYVEGEVLHVDGIRREGAFQFVSASAYLNTCLDFTTGTPLGSVLLDRGERLDTVTAFAAAALDALGLETGPFHLELFETPCGELVFLEVGLRPGGADVPFLHRDLFGIDLYAEAFRATVGLPAQRAAEELSGSGGWVAVPEPQPYPSRVLARTSMLDAVAEVYAEVLPEIGAVLDGSGGYEHIGGRFRLRGADHATVRRAALEVMDRYRLLVAQLDPVAGR